MASVAVVVMDGNFLPAVPYRIKSSFSGGMRFTGAFRSMSYSRATASRVCQ